MQEKISTSKGIQRIMMMKAVETGRKRNIDFLRLEKKVPFFLECRYRLWDKLVLSKIRKAIGVENGNIFPTAGRAPLSDTINEFFASCGIKYHIRIRTFGNNRHGNLF